MPRSLPYRKRANATTLNLSLRRRVRGVARRTPLVHRYGGMSCGGINSVRIAARAPPALKALTPTVMRRPL
jgi:hypothetical protein